MTWNKLNSRHKATICAKNSLPWIHSVASYSDRPLALGVCGTQGPRCAHVPGFQLGAEQPFPSLSRHWDVRNQFCPCHGASKYWSLERCLGPTSLETKLRPAITRQVVVVFCFGCLFFFFTKEGFIMRQKRFFEEIR